MISLDLMKLSVVRKAGDRSICQAINGILRRYEGIAPLRHMVRTLTKMSTILL